MKILFLHPNFPAQFKEACRQLASERHDVRFLCQTHYGRSIQGVQRLTIKGAGSHEVMELKKETELKKMYSRAESYREAFKLLKKEEWQPDVIVSHSGWGCGFYAKEVWPNVPLIAYCEWWFAPNSELMQTMRRNLYFNISKISKKHLWQRNAVMAMELATADHITTPTNWQKKQLPYGLQKKCCVSPERVNHHIFYPDSLQISPIPKITYGTRGMEPMRGFPEFINCIPELVKKWPTLSVEIAGVDEINYGGKPPEEGSWGKWAKRILSAQCLKNVHWKGRMNLDTYANWLKSSWCHIYLTEPYVASWSLNEAIACQIPIVATDHEAVTEFTEGHMDIVLVNHHSKKDLFDAINHQIRLGGRLRQSSHITSIAKKQALQPLATLVERVAGDEANTSV